MPTLAGTFAAADWAVLALYFLLLGGSGVWFSRRHQTGTDDYFLAGRRMPAWAVTISVLATSLSAATFLGAPQEAYDGSLAYLIATLGTLVAAAVVALFFIPAFYRHRVTTVYELLGARFGGGAKNAASWTFMIGRVFASGARVYIAAHALSYLLFGNIEPGNLIISILALSAAGVLYTIAGGIETVIWTDCIQTVIFIAAVAAALVLLVVRIPAPMSEVLEALRTAGHDSASKLTVVDLSLDPSRAFTLWTALTGFALLNIAALGADQDLVQRMLTCRSALRASLSVVWSQLIAIPVVLIFMLLGLFLYIFYQRPDLMGAAYAGPPPDDSREVFLYYMLTQMPPGMSGLMMAGLFAAGLTSLDSSLNAMSSTFVNDCYKRIRPGRSEAHYLRAGRIGVAAWGAVLALFACFCVYWQRNQADQGTLLAFALKVMLFAYTGLVAVYFCALFTRRGRVWSVVAALATGFLATLILDPIIWNRLLPGVRIAFPWRMVIATALAMAVCCIPPAPPGRTAPTR